MTAKLPTWATEQQSVDVRDAERVRRMSVDERMKIARMLCRDAARLLTVLSPEQREKALAYRDPLPENSRALFQRLRREARNPVPAGGRA